MVGEGGPMVKLVLCVPVCREWGGLPPEQVEDIVRKLLEKAFFNAMNDFSISKYMRWL